MKEYPAYIIDRSRRSQASRFSDDFIVCTDRECGFIARVFKVPKSRREEFSEFLSTPPVGGVPRVSARVIGDSVVAMEIVRFFHEPVAPVNRIPPLMKKAMKAYLFGEERTVARNNQTYDNQIAAIEDTIRMAEAQYPHMVDMNGAGATERFIDALKDAKESISLLQKIVKHE